MTGGGGRAKRPDDWPSSHVRAREDLSDRLDLPLEPTEANWLDEHLGACSDCAMVADSYATQRLELRALRDRMPPPPRDLWARTAAAIETESRFRGGHARLSGSRNRRSFAPAALLATALVVAVAIGTLTSSQRPFGDGATGSSGPVAAATSPSQETPGDVAGGGPTPIPAPRTIAYLTCAADGDCLYNVRSVAEVCPPASTEPCATDATVEDHPVSLDQNASTVFGSPDVKRLIVVNDPTSANSGTISVVSLGSAAPDAVPTPTPTVAPSATPTTSVASESPPVTVTAPPSAGPSVTQSTDSPPSSTSPASPSAGSPSPSIAVTPMPDGAVEIARDVVLVGQSAAYSASGRWFAFTARPVNGSAGPDIYAWKVGDPLANRITTDHRSVFGSWSGDTMVGSTVVVTTKGAGTELEPASFLLDPATAAITNLPQTGKAWRPA
ncbi:MAG: zf-HC2 domain-containing protein, partial [Candidatus Limnocylindrales bacterium]